jgi:hypothetical protein
MLSAESGNMDLQRNWSNGWTEVVQTNKRIDAEPIGKIYSVGHGGGKTNQSDRNAHCTADVAHTRNDLQKRKTHLAINLKRWRENNTYNFENRSTLFSEQVDFINYDESNLLNIRTALPVSADTVPLFRGGQNDIG